MNSPTETETEFHKLLLVVTDMSSESFFVAIKLFEVLGMEGDDHVLSLL